MSRIARRPLPNQPHGRLRDARLLARVTLKRAAAEVCVSELLLSRVERGVIGFRIGVSKTTSLLDFYRTEIESWRKRPLSEEQRKAASIRGFFIAQEAERIAEAGPIQPLRSAPFCGYELIESSQARALGHDDDDHLDDGARDQIAEWLSYEFARGLRTR